MQEVSLKEEMLVKMEGSLDNYRRKYAVVRHQQGLLYQDHMAQKKVHGIAYASLLQLYAVVIRKLSKSYVSASTVCCCV